MQITRSDAVSDNVWQCPEKLVNGALDAGTPNACEDTGGLPTCIDLSRVTVVDVSGAVDLLVALEVLARKQRGLHLLPPVARGVVRRLSLMGFWHHINTLCEYDHSVSEGESRARSGGSLLPIISLLAPTGDLRHRGGQALEDVLRDVLLFVRGLETAAGRKDSSEQFILETTLFELSANVFWHSAARGYIAAEVCHVVGSRLNWVRIAVGDSGRGIGIDLAQRVTRSSGSRAVDAICAACENGVSSRSVGRAERGQGLGYLTHLAMRGRAAFSVRSGGVRVTFGLHERQAAWKNAALLPGVQVAVLLPGGVARRRRRV
jgi:hypothetical protein